MCFPLRRYALPPTVTIGTTSNSMPVPLLLALYSVPVLILYVPRRVWSIRPNGVALCAFQEEREPRQEKTTRIARQALRSSSPERRWQPCFFLPRVAGAGAGDRRERTSASRRARRVQAAGGPRPAHH